MLMGIGGSETNDDPTAFGSTEQISSGIESEVRSELTEAAGEGESGTRRIEHLEQALEALQNTVSAQLRRPPRSSQHTSMDSLADAVRGLPVEARALLSILLRGGHLTRSEYRSAVQNNSLKLGLKALRSAGLLLPLEGIEDGESVPVYWLPPGLARRLRVASQLAGEVPADVLAEFPLC